MTQGSKDSENQHVKLLPIDAQLYPRLMANDEEAWRSFHSHYLPRLLSYFGNRYVKMDEDREDLVQETCAIFFRTLLSEKYNPQQGTLVQWLYGIARKVLNRYRKLYVEEFSKQDELREDQPVEDEAAASTSLSDNDKNWLNSALAQLSDKTRAVVLLKTRVSSDWTWKDIASELKISESAAKMRYQRGLEELRRLLS